MFRRKPRSKNSFLILRSSSRGSDIVKPDNTSLVVNDSDTEIEGLPKELTSVLSENEDDNIEDTNRKSSSLMKSLSQKTQSTPRNRQSNPNRVLKEINNAITQNFETATNVKSNSSQASNKSCRRLNSESDGQKIDSYFTEVVRACGASPMTGDSSYLMYEDQAVFSLKVNNKLKENNENLELFLKSIKNEMGNPEKFQKMLTHTLTAENCEVARGPVQDPLMRMLLNAECLQAELIELLLKKLADMIIDGEMGHNDLQIVSTILRQIRFLNRVKEVKIAPKLFEIIHVASVTVQREIIFVLPEIVTEDEAEEASMQLIEMMRVNKHLTNVVVDAVTNLPLNRRTRSQVRERIITRLDKCPMDFLPSLVQFILNRSDAEDVTEVINGLRENLPFTMAHYEMKNVTKTNGLDTKQKLLDEDSYVKLTFENLKFSVIASKLMTDVWIKIISAINSGNEFKCIDLMMLIIFYNCCFGRKNQILSLMRNKIKSIVLTEEHVRNMFKILFVVAMEYFSSVLEVASVLLKSFDQMLSDFGEVLYKECFICSHNYMKQIVITEILLHVGTGTPSTINTALHLLRNLCESHGESLSHHTASVMGLLIKLQDLDPVQVRLLVDVVAHLIFFKSAEINVGWQDELQMYIRKQLASSKLEQVKKGIVAAIVYGKHAGKAERSESLDFAQINSLLDMATGSGGACDVKKGFFNDEFATAVRESLMGTPFLESWKKKYHQITLDNLFVRNIELTCEHFPMSLQYSLGTVDDQSLVFPVVDFVVNSNSKKLSNVNVSTIPSTLRLLWCCEENLSELLPAFCASVIMPEVTVFDKFSTFDAPQKKIIMNCLFLCANYLIECINALCSHKFLDKALLRVKQLICIQKLILTHLHSLTDYIPPHCQFYAPVEKLSMKKKKVEKVAKQGRKRKLEEVADASVAISQFVGTSTSSSFDVGNGRSEGSVELGILQECRGYFRELCCRICDLLEADLKLNARKTNQVECEIWPCRPPEKPELSPCDLLFLLEDLNSKAEKLLKETKRGFGSRSKSRVSRLDRETAEEFVAGSLRILPKLLSKMELLSAYCKNLLEANDGMYDGLGMYPKDGSDIKLALAAALKFVAEIILWPGFQSPNYKSFFEDILRILSRKKTSGCGNSKEIASRGLEAAEYLAGFGDSVLLLSGGISIVKSFQALLQHCTLPEPHDPLGDLCHKLLCRPWFTVSGSSERGALYNQHIDFLLKTYFANVDNKLEIVRGLAKAAVAEVERLKEKDSTMETLKSINKSNFPLLYRMMCEALVKGSSAELSKGTENDDATLETWNTIVETLLVLVEIVKIHCSRVNLASLLKRSQSVIQLFFSKGMPVVESALRVKSVEVLKVLKSLQTVTRFLHSICCHSKITSDSVVAAHVPTIRSQCERLTLEVKGALILNELPMDCITIAILKNRDLKGNDIISQETNDDDSCESSELPSEEEEDETNAPRGNAEDDAEQVVLETTQESHSEDY